MKTRTSNSKGGVKKDVIKRIYPTILSSGHSEHTFLMLYTVGTPTDQVSSVGHQGPAPTTKLMEAERRVAGVPPTSLNCSAKPTKGGRKAESKDSERQGRSQPINAFCCSSSRSIYDLMSHCLSC